jgi:ABC-type nitrate/sulfonate/bicarbonate transport system permease component
VSSARSITGMRGARARTAGPGRTHPLAALRRGLTTAALAVAGVAVVIGVWWLISLGMDPVRVPSPKVVFDTLRADWNNIPALQFIAFQEGGIRQAVTYTAVNVVVGAGIGSAAGFLLGAFLGRARLAREMLEPPLFVLSTIPVLVLAPFLTIWFGTARIVQAGLVIVFALVTVAAVTQRATLDVGARYTQYAESLGASQGMVLRQVVLPAVVPAALGAVRVAVAAGWSFETVAELLGGNHGTGKLIQSMQGLSATADIMAAVIALGITAVLVDAAIRLIGSWVVRWQE